jgi:hypothetical protein
MNSFNRMFAATFILVALAISSGCQRIEEENDCQKKGMTCCRIESAPGKYADQCVPTKNATEACRALMQGLERNGNYPNFSTTERVTNICAGM